MAQPPRTDLAPSDSLASDVLGRARAQWRRRHLNVGSLPRGVRWLVLGTLAVSGVAGILIVVLGQGWSLPGGRQPLVGASVPRVLIPFSYVGFAAAATAVTAAACRRSGPWRALALGGVALVGCVVAASAIGAARQVNLHHPPLLPFLGGWAGIVAALVAPIVALRAPRSWAAPALSATPFLLGLVVYASWRGQGVSLDGFVAPLSPRDLLGFELVSVLATINIGVAMLVIWGVLESTAAARDVLSLSVRPLRPFPAAVGTLLAAKVVWLAVGLAGALPQGIGGPRDAWRSSRNNGLIAWLLSAIMVAAAAWWLSRSGRRQIIERGLRPASWAIAGGMAFGLALVAGAFLGVVLASAWSTIGPLHAFQSMYNSLLTGNAVFWAVVGTVGVAILGGALLVRIERHRSAALMLLVFAVWALPRAIALAWLLMHNGRPPFRSIEPATLDAVVSIAAALLALLWWLNVQRAVDPVTLLFVVAVSTLIAHPSVVLPSGWKHGALFYLALVFPLAYQFLADSESLNQPGEGRDGRVLSVVGLAVVPLTITVLFVALGFTHPGSSSPLSQFVGGVVSLYLAVPVAAMLVVARLTDPERPLD